MESSFRNKKPIKSSSSLIKLKAEKVTRVKSQCEERKDLIPQSKSSKPVKIKGGVKQSVSRNMKKHTLHTELRKDDKGTLSPKNVEKAQKTKFGKLLVNNSRKRIVKSP